jgi:hypothetical protein
MLTNWENEGGAIRAQNDTTNYTLPIPEFITQHRGEWDGVVLVYIAGALREKVLVSAEALGEIYDAIDSIGGERVTYLPPVGPV